MLTSRNNDLSWILATIVKCGNRRFWGWHELFFVTFFGFYFSCVHGTKTFFFAYTRENSPVQPLINYDVEGHMGAPLTLLRLCSSEWISRKIRVGRSLNNVVMSWLRLQTCTDCIPHPCHMNTQCFNTLICCGWAYGCTLTLLRLCRSGVEFRNIELSPRK